MSPKKPNEISKTKKLETQASDNHEEIVQLDKVSPELSFPKSPNPFYVSLFLHGFKLSNCIIDSGSSDNIMPTVLAKAFDLPLTNTFGKCYSMDSKQVPLIGQIKDAQVSLVTYPQKRIKLTILIEDIPTSYGMLLSQTFYQNLGGS